MATLLPAQAWAAPPGGRNSIQLPALQKDAKVELDKAAAAQLEDWSGGAPTEPAPYTAKEEIPPPAGSASVALSGDQLVQAGSLPVSLGKAAATAENPTPPDPSGTWSVAVESRATTEAVGVDGAIIKVTPPEGASTPVEVHLDYSKFEDLYGTEWASRLQLKQRPECFLTTPDLPECAVAKDIPTVNEGHAVHATVDPATAPGQGLRTMAVGGTTSVVTAEDSGAGPGGTYKATSLAPSGSWTAGGSGGGFSWSYPLTLPAPPNGPSPKIAFSYSSQAVDGKTSVANSQASWIGDGWDYEPGYIERRYRSCSEDRKATPGAPNNDNDTDKKKGDLCWAGDNVVMSLGGSTTELVRDAATGRWVPASDDGSRIERKTDAALGNGAKDGEYWVVTTRDGTRYHFGLHDVDGGGSRPVTNSVFTVPVFGNHPGEPCHQSAYAASSCTQGWRWNLDYVEDVNGNAMVVDWSKETNHYAKNGKTTEKVPYVRGGYPTGVSYGLRAGNLNGAPAAKVEFAVKERCFPTATTGCAEADFEANQFLKKQPWWDTPATLHCKADVKECDKGAPTFWTRKRLETVTTYAQRTEGSTGLSKVDQWTLKQSFPTQRTDSHPPLWLDSIIRTGYGTTLDAAGQQLGTSLPPVIFEANAKDMPNRVAKGLDAKADPIPDFDRLRVETIRTETGGEIAVTYSAPCAVGTITTKPEENGTRCYPVRWSPDGDVQTPPIEWFNKYVVDKVTEKDRVARQPDVTTTYTYEGKPAWAKDTDEFTKPELRTYNQWRGYESVLVNKGVTANTGTPEATEESQTRTRYFRGMSGDAGRAEITVKDSTGTETLGKDLPQYQGRVAETITYTKAGGSVVARELSWPWESKKTASRPRDGTTALEAYPSGTARTDKIQTVSGGGTRIVRSLTAFDETYALPKSAQVETHTPNGTGGWTVADQVCALTQYVHNTDKHIIGLAQQVTTTAGDCTQATSGAPLISNTRTSFDAPNAFGVAPVKGLPYQIDTNDAAGTGWVTTTRIEYDELGRSTKVHDAAGNTTATAFSPATGPAFATTVTNPLGHTATTKSDPGRGTVLEVTDANGRKASTGYDHFGRATAAWTPSQKPATDKPAYTFSYQISEHQPPVVTTGVLRDNGTYQDSVAIYDGLLRPFQTQKEALGGGRLITDTLYSANGTVRETRNNYLAEGEPENKPFVPLTVVPNSTKAAYDGLGRPTRVTTLHAGTPQHSSITQYEGDWTLTRSAVSPAGSNPLPGSRAAKTWTDAAGRTTLIQHATATDLTTWNDTTYAYDLRGKLTKVTDTAGNNWTYSYDARGRKTGSSDPDMGTAAIGYNNLDQQVWTENAAGEKTFTYYDKLGRKTSEHENDWNGPLAATWTYDTLPGAKGQPASSTRHTNGMAITTEVTGYDTEYRPTGSKITIPDTAATKGLAGTYTYSTAYTPTGKVQSTTLPGTPGGLAAERLVTRYNAEGMPTTLSGLSWYTADTVYSPFGEVLQTASGKAPNRVWSSNFRDPNTGRLTQSITDRETASPDTRISALSYTYNTAGSITAVTDTQPGGRVDRQCYTYDPMGQLTQAWTGKTCAGPVEADVTPGPDGDGYWQSYTFDAIGNRKTLTDHDLADQAHNDTFTYTYGVTASGGTQPPITTKPHALTKVDSVVRKPGSTVASQSTYTYDSSGNTTGRTIGGDTQTLEWDRRNRLTSATSPGIGAVPIQGLSGKCLDLDNGLVADGTPIQLVSCNASKAQQWRLTEDTLRFRDKCVTNQNGALRLVACNGGPEQKFTYRAGDKSLHHPATNQCVDVPAWNDTDGTDLGLWTCNAQANQQWSFSHTTTYLYDSSGNRLIEDTGSTRTLYLGETTVTVNTAGQPLDATRSYAGPGGPTTVRQTLGKNTGHKLTVQLADHHNTATTSVEQSDGQPLIRRKFDPYGNPRGAEPTTWSGNRTYLGVGVADASTDLTHIGAREYDPTTGRFISVDPILDITDPLQMNGYTYANANPVNNSDPSGLKYFEGGNDDPGFEAAPEKVVEVATRRQNRRNNIAADTRNSYQRAIERDLHPTRNKPLRTRETHGAEYARMHVDYDPTSGSVVKQIAWKMWLVGASEEELEYLKLRPCDFLECYGPADALVTGKLIDSPIYDAPTSQAFGESFAAGVGARAGAGAKGPKSVRPCNSFVPGTHVLLADGTSKPIEELEPGDDVVATDPETGETAVKDVTATITGQGEKDLIDVTIDLDSDAGTATATVTATNGHPFWVPELNEWVDAADLRPGTQLLTETGTHVQVAEIKRWTLPATVHNLTIDDLHTYYVLAGQTPVLVHNSTPCPTAINLGPRPAGVGDDWVGRGADNGKGIVWQKPGSTGNADMVRVMDATGRYPNGYVRFHNKSGQPIGLNGKPGSKADTHIPMNPDGTYPLPAGW
ncbi:polymorphic toxin-type HINT domain-containing protein [Streptomyces sp. NPDC090022]|uniref:polymorphic toxin-type HINT domain-containing protein n=1 Tax=Streptomyces sp. NPDC090022 TaxID=3365920 RepID=UPI00382915C4